jgi:lipopolysaccharide/colanic/teichoic acid biosynthesis glycosyltransferase
MPKLLSIHNYHFRHAGSDVLFLAHDELFRERGWETAIFSMHHRENLPSRWSEYFVEEIDLGRQYSLAKKIHLAAKVLYSREARTQLRRLIYRFRPDVVHVHNVYHHISPSIFPILRELGVPIILTAHDYKLACPAYKMFDGKAVCEQCKGGHLLPLLRKRCVHDSVALSALVAAETALHRRLKYYENCIDRIVCPSQFLLEKLVAWGWSREKLVHIPNCFDSDGWSPCFDAGGYFLYFGRLSPEKGVSTLLRACAITNRPVKIVGTGPSGDELRKLSQQLGAPADFVDHLPKLELAEQIRGCRAVVLPSEWYENAPLAILESFACGKPVIAARIGGNPELVREGVNGWLYNPRDSHSLAECLDRAWTMSDSEIEELGRAAHEFVSHQFSASRYYKETTRLYAELEGRKQPDCESALRSGRLKRSMDIALALPMFLLALPLLVVLMLVIALDSPGNPVFTQERVGRGGRPFKLYKLRGFHRHSHGIFPNEEIRPGDPRVTRMGKFLRHHKLDELPQLINVLLGHMSLVGPRPDIPLQVEAYGDVERQRLAVRPGLTGIAQISGNAWLDWNLRIRLDHWYIKNHSIRLDCAILIHTLAVLRRGERPEDDPVGVRRLLSGEMAARR